MDECTLWTNIWSDILFYSLCILIAFFSKRGGILKKGYVRNVTKELSKEQHEHLFSEQRNGWVNCPLPGQLYPPESFRPVLEGYSRSKEEVILKCLLLYFTYIVQNFLIVIKETNPNSVVNQLLSEFRKTALHRTTSLSEESWFFLFDFNGVYFTWLINPMI